MRPPVIDLSRYERDVLAQVFRGEIESPVQDLDTRVAMAYLLKVGLLCCAGTGNAQATKPIYRVTIPGRTYLPRGTQ